MRYKLDKMLSESFIAAALVSSANTLASSAQLKDAGIFAHSFQPKSALTKTFKKSSIGPNCLEVNDTHVFAAQAQKAVVNVYNRTNGKHEITAHFNSKIHSLILICGGTVLALGGEDGTIALWELCTGRLTYTSPTHLQAVSVLAADITSNFLLSGSKDSQVDVWSVIDLLAFVSGAGSSSMRLDHAKPKHRLSGHRDAITALVTGHSATALDIAISASRDKTALVWNYRIGQRLQTILLESTPLCLALDPADRAFYAGLEDGGIQFVSFYKNGRIQTNIADLDSTDVPMQPGPSTVKYPKSSVNKSESTSTETTSTNYGSILSIALSYDADTILTGHSTGKIARWSSTVTGDFSETLVSYDGLPITNIAFLPPEGWAKNKTTHLRPSSVIKPMPHEDFSGSKSQLTKSYQVTAQLPSGISKPRRTRSFKRLHLTQKRLRFQELLQSQIFPDQVLAASAAECACWNNTNDAGEKSQIKSEDFISINSNSDSTDSKMMVDDEKEHMAKQIADLKNKVKHLQKVAVANAKHIDELFSENEMWRRTTYGESQAYERMALDGENGGSATERNGAGTHVSEQTFVDDSEEEESSEDSDSAPVNNLNQSPRAVSGRVADKSREDAQYESDEGATRERQATPEKYVVLR